MRERIPRVPLPAVVGGILLLLASVTILIVGGQATGVSWDEPYRVGKLNNLFTSGWFVDDVADGQPLDFNAFVYAPIADLFSHAVGVLAGAQDWTLAATTAQAYAARHLAIGVLALIAMAAAGSIAGLLLGSWRWGLVTAALLGVVPLWTGHAMINSSDIPVAAGYTLVTLGVVVVARVVPNGPPWRAVAGSGGLIGVGVLLSIGTRPATWPAMLVSLGLALVSAVVLAPSGDRRRSLVRVGSGVLGAAALAWLVLLAVYPNAFGSPVRLLVESVSQSARFGDATDAPQETRPLLEAVGYLPSWLAIQLPIVIGVLCIAGLAVATVFVVRTMVRRSPDPADRWRAAGAVAVLAQLLVLPAGAAIMRSSVYDGVRQFLFILPVLAVFAAIGLALVVALLGALSRGSRVLPAVVWALVGVSVLLPVVDQLRLFPYGYTYVNEVAAREPVDGRLPTDYWRTSMRELIPLIPASGATACNFDPLVLGLVPIDCATQGQLSPFWDSRGREGLGISVPSGKYVFLEANRGRVDPGPGCSIVDAVTRTLHGQELTMSYAAICEAPCVVEEAAQCAAKSLSGANLDGWNLRSSNFAGADFSGTSLVLADLSGANLAGADLTDAVLASANLTGADLTGADLTGANVHGTTFDGAILEGAIGLPSTVTDGEGAVGS